jgi:hypothetical protein
MRKELIKDAIRLQLDINEDIAATGVTETGKADYLDYMIGLFTPEESDMFVILMEDAEDA